MLLALDPGADTGWALFDSTSRLAACGLGGPPSDGVEQVVIECPRLRPRGEKNPNAILLVARNAGEWAGRYAHAAVRYVLPNDWKGSTKKGISSKRTQLKLDENESEIVDSSFRKHKGRNGLAPSKRHNVWDAIGIGLWAVGR